MGRKRKDEQIKSPAPVQKEARHSRKKGAMKDKQASQKTTKAELRKAKKCKDAKSQQKRVISRQRNHEKIQVNRTLSPDNPFQNSAISKLSQKHSSEAMSERPPGRNEYMEEYEFRLQRLREEVLQEEETSQNDQKFENEEDSAEVEIVKALHAYKEKIQIASSAQSDPFFASSAPSEQDITLALTSLENRFPETNIVRLLRKLYNCLILKTPDGEAVRYCEQPVLPQPSVGSREVEAEMPKLSHNKRHVTKRYIRHPQLNEQFRSEEEEIRFKQKRLVASAFVNRDYGIAGVQEHVAKSGEKVMIQRTRYKTLASTVATDAYRKLEEFLIRECHRGIKQLNREEIRSIVTVLLNCRRNFQAEDCCTYFKFMKIVYGIGSVTITQDAAIRLYISVQKSLKARMAQMQLQRMYDTMRCNKQFKARRSFQSERFQLHRIWTNELEEELLRLYKRDMQLVRIRDHFKQKYPQHQHLFTIDSLRSRFHKILRVALRKVKCFCEKFGPERVPGLITLNDLKVKFILRSPDAMNARLLLVDMYLNDECDLKRLYNTVSAVNDFIIMKDTQRMSEIIEAEPQIKFATEKSNHNMAASKSRPKESRRQPKDNVFLKAQEQDFDHFVQIENGQNLHYYKMSSGERGENRQVKLEDGNQKMQPTEDKQASRDRSSISNSKRQPSLAQQQHAHSAQKASASSSRAIFENIIKEQLQKYMRSRSSDDLSGYAL